MARWLHVLARLRPKRRWLQFSLQGLLAAFVVISCLLGWYVHQAREQCRIVREIRVAGGEVEFYSDFPLIPHYRTPRPDWLWRPFGNEYQSDVRSVRLPLRLDRKEALLDDLAKLNGLQGISVSWLSDKDEGAAPWTDADAERVSRVRGLRNLLVANTAFTDAAMRSLAKFPEMERIQFAKCQITDQGLASLPPKLKSLCLRHGNITDAGLKHLARCPELSSLDLCQTSISGVGMDCLRYCPKLVTLNLAFTEVNDEGLRSLIHCPELSRLNLDGTEVTDDGMPSLLHCPKLTEVWLGQTRVTDAAMEYVAQFPALGLVNLSHTSITDAGLERINSLPVISIYLDGTKVTDDGMPHLTGMTTLRLIMIADTQISDAGLTHLFALKVLGYLNLKGTQVTDAGVAALRKALPQCQVQQ